MKKLIIIAATAVAAIGIGAAPAGAQAPDPDPLPTASLPLPTECSERDLNAPDSDGDGIPNDCVEFYVGPALPPAELDVTGFFPECVKDAPFVVYNIRPIAFVPTEPITATLTVRDVNGTLVETLVVNSLSGSFIFPGASVDANGNATDWPGWVQTNTGDWVVDPTDQILRQGLIITVEINPTAVAQVSYAPESSVCASPPQQTTLPRTGSGVSAPLQAGAVLLVIGAIALIATKRRSAATAAS